MGNLFKTHAERAARTEEKRARLVEWLRDEKFTDYQTAGAVLGVTPKAAYKTLTATDRDGITERHRVGRSSVWSLTMRGLLEYMGPEDDPQGLFDARISEATVLHTLAIQRARLAAEAAGWTAWKAERIIKREAQTAREAGTASPWMKQPDALGVTPSGVAVAVEVERTPKTPKRYQAIMADYLQMAKAGTLHEVHYITETARMRDGLERLFRSIKTVTVRGTEVPLKAEHCQVFRFFGPEDWPGKA